MSTTPDYDALSAWAESEEPTVQPGTVVRRGADARADAMALLEGAASSDEDRELLRRGRGGRPPLDAAASPGTKSPTWNVRAPAPLDEAARARARAEGKEFSEFIRDVVGGYLEAS